MTRKPSLVLVPGMLCDRTFWRGQIEPLADGVNVQVFSHGRLDSIEAMAQSALAQAPPTFALAGHSMGGRVALEIYRRAPERVTKLALLCTDFRGHASADDHEREAEERQGLLALARKEGIEAFSRVWIRRVVPPWRLADAAFVSAVVGMFASHPFEVLAAQTLAGLNRADYTDLLPDIACPVLVCAGREDALRSLAVHREMISRIPSAHLAVIVGCGHMAAMERPAEVAAILRDWLAGKDVGAGSTVAGNCPGP